VSDVRGKLPNEIEVSKLAWRALFWLLMKSEGNKLVICVDYKSSFSYDENV